MLIKPYLLHVLSLQGTRSPCRPTPKPFFNGQVVRGSAPLFAMPDDQMRDPAQRLYLTKIELSPRVPSAANDPVDGIDDKSNRLEQFAHRLLSLDEKITDDEIRRIGLNNFDIATVLSGERAACTLYKNQVSDVPAFDSEVTPALSIDGREIFIFHLGRAVNIFDSQAVFALVREMGLSEQLDATLPGMVFNELSHNLPKQEVKFQVCLLRGYCHGIEGINNEIFSSYENWLLNGGDIMVTPQMMAHAQRTMKDASERGFDEVLQDLKAFSVNHPSLQPIYSLWSESNQSIRLPIELTDLPIAPLESPNDYQRDDASTLKILDKPLLNELKDHFRFWEKTFLGYRRSAGKMPSSKKFTVGNHCFQQYILVDDGKHLAWRDLFRQFESIRFEKETQP